MDGASLVANYREFLSFLPLPAFIVTRGESDFIFEYANDALLKALDLRPEQMIGGTVDVLVSEAMARYIRDQYHHAFAHGVPVEFEVSLDHPDGPHDWMTTIYPAVATDGTVHALVGYAADVTVRKREQMVDGDYHSRMFSEMVDSHAELEIRFAADTTILEVNDAFCEALDLTRAQLIGQQLLELVPLRDQIMLRDHLAAFSPSRPRQTATLPVKGAKGRRLWHRLREVASFDASGTLLEVNAVGHDVTDMQDALFRALHSEVRFRAVVDNICEGIVLADARGTIKYANAKLLDILGWEPNDLLGMNVSVLANPTDARQHEGYLKRYLETNVAHVVGIGRETLAQHRNGALIPIHLSMSDVILDGGRHFVAVIRDISALNQANERIERLAYRDELTELPNRRQAAEVMGRRFRDGQAHAYLIVDLCKFSRLNNAVGFALGDRVLQETARQISRMLPQDAVVARVGGDQFGIILPGNVSYSTLEAVARKVTGAVDREIVSEDANGVLMQGGFFLPPVTIGCATAPRHGENAEALIEAAEIALIEAKKMGPGSVCIFNSDMRTAIDRHFTLAQGLRRAIEHRELVVYIQPRFRASDRRCLGGEALIRWIDSSGKIISPADFIPIAEETGLVQPITFFVLEEIMPILRRLRVGQRISVNFPPVVLSRRNLAGALKVFLDRHQVPGSALAIEVTESALTGDQRFLDATLRDLRSLGLVVAIDDFGTGYSSLSRLQTLPIDELKIDRAFVREAARSKAGAQFLQAIAGMGKALGLHLIAEGVETEAELAEVRRTECNEVQGYLWGRPMPLMEFEALLRETAVVGQDD